MALLTTNAAVVDAVQGTITYVQRQGRKGVIPLRFWQDDAGTVPQPLAKWRHTIPQADLFMGNLSRGVVDRLDSLAADFEPPTVEGTAETNRVDIVVPRNAYLPEIPPNSPRVPIIVAMLLEQQLSGLERLYALQIALRYGVHNGS